jgi:hypothetical protein
MGWHCLLWAGSWLAALWGHRTYAAVLTRILCSGVTALCCQRTGAVFVCYRAGPYFAPAHCTAVCLIERSRPLCCHDPCSLRSVPPPRTSDSVLNQTCVPNSAICGHATPRVLPLSTAPCPDFLFPERWGQNLRGFGDLNAFLAATCVPAADRLAWSAMTQQGPPHPAVLPGVLRVPRPGQYTQRPHSGEACTDLPPLLSPGIGD